MDEILLSDHSNESFWAVLSCGTVYYAVQGGFNFWVCGWNPMVWPFKWKLLSSTFRWDCFFVIYKQLVSKSSSNVWVCRRNHMVWPFKWKLLSSNFLCRCLLVFYYTGTKRFLKVCEPSPLVSVAIYKPSFNNNKGPPRHCWTSIRCNRIFFFFFFAKDLEGLWTYSGETLS